MLKTNQIQFLGQEEFEIHRPLEEYVHHYETLNYDNSYIDQQHKRHKRSAPAQKDIKLIYSRDSQNEQPHIDLEFSESEQSQSRSSYMSS